MLYTIIPQAKLPRNMEGLYTYHGEDAYKRGALAVVEFRKRDVLGLIVEEATEVDVRAHPNHLLKPIKKYLGPTPFHLTHLIQWVAEYYIVSPAFVWKSISPPLLKRRLSKQKQSTIRHNQKTTHTYSLSSVPPLLQNQKIDRTFNLSLKEKYELYIQLVQQIWARGATAMLLTPTISDVNTVKTCLPKTWQHKTAVFTGDTYKSMERHWHTWWHVMQKEQYDPCLILGTRSAVFAPIHNLGLIIIDKTESDDFKQYDQNPRYDARKVAQKVGELTECAVKMFSDGVVFPC